MTSELRAPPQVVPPFQGSNRSARAVLQLPGTGLVANDDRKKNYHKLMLRYHPDRCSKNKTVPAEKVEEICTNSAKAITTANEFLEEELERASRPAQTNGKTRPRTSTRQNPPPRENTRQNPPPRENTRQDPPPRENTRQDPPPRENTPTTPTTPKEPIQYFILTFFIRFRRVPQSEEIAAFRTWVTESIKRAQRVPQQADIQLYVYNLNPSARPKTGPSARPKTGPSARPPGPGPSARPQSGPSARPTGPGHEDPAKTPDIRHVSPKDEKMRVNTPPPPKRAAKEQSAARVYVQVRNLRQAKERVRQANGTFLKPWMFDIHLPTRAFTPSFMVSSTHRVNRVSDVGTYVEAWRKRYATEGKFNYAFINDEYMGFVESLPRYRRTLDGVRYRVRADSVMVKVCCFNIDYAMKLVNPAKAGEQAGEMANKLKGQ